jgi:hypothetical protein
MQNRFLLYNRPLIKALTHRFKKKTCSSRAALCTQHGHPHPPHANAPHDHITQVLWFLARPTRPCASFCATTSRNPSHDPVYVRSLAPSDLAFSLSSHRVTDTHLYVFSLALASPLTINTKSRSQSAVCISGVYLRVRVTGFNTHHSFSS